MQELLTALWTFANSPLGMALAAAAVAFALGWIRRRRPSWEPWTGTIIEACKAVEKSTLATTPSANKFKIALSYVVKAFEEAQKRPPTDEELQVLSQGISTVHADLEAAGNLDAAPKAGGGPNVLTCWLLAGLLGMAAMVGGCAAGTSAELLSYDNIEAAANEAKKGVVAYDLTIRAEQANTAGEVTAALAKDVTAIAARGGLPPADAAALGERVGLSVKAHMANLTEQERRRQALFEPTVDNLDFIIQVCAQGRQFAIYRSDVSAQWRSYLETTARARLRKVDTSTVLPTPK